MLEPGGPSGRKVVFHLLRDRPRRPTARSVADAVGVSYQSVSEILRFLEFHGALTMRPRAEIRWSRLAGIAASLRLPAIHPRRTWRIPGDLPTISRFLEEHDLPHVFAFTTAANLWAYFEQDPTVNVIVDRKAFLRSPGIHKEEDGLKTVRVFVDDLELLDVSQLQKVPVTTQLQTWIDLRYFPQAGAHAAFFQQVIAEAYPEVLES